MNCFLCGKKIGFIRSLSDQQYCCSDHRKEARLASAQALRDEDDLESWAVARNRKKNGGAAARGVSKSNAGAVLAFVAVGGVMVAVLMLGGAAKGGAAHPSVSFATGKTTGFVDRASGVVGGWVRDVAPVTLKQNFSSGSLSSKVSDWANLKLASNIDDPRDWIGKTRTTSSLRLWSKSTAMQNYEMEFQGTIEKQSLSWAIRASDAKNYYSTRLAIMRPGPLPNAALIRSTMVNGREVERSQSPLRIVLERGKPYNIRVKAQGDTFLTYFNGEWIGQMSDQKLIRGGVGFFDDANDPQKIAWVSVSERDSLLGRMLSVFGLFTIPGANQPQ